MLMFNIKFVLRFVFAARPNERATVRYYYVLPVVYLAHRASTHIYRGGYDNVKTLKKKRGCLR